MGYCIKLLKSDETWYGMNRTLAVDGRNRFMPGIENFDGRKVCRAFLAMCERLGDPAPRHLARARTRQKFAQVS